MSSVSSKHKFKFAVSTILTVVAVYLLGQVVAAVIYFLITPDLETDPTPLQTLIIYIGLSATVLGCIYYVLHVSNTGFHAVRRRLGIHKPTSSDVGYTLLGFGAYFVIFLAISLLVTQLGLIDADQPQDTGFGEILQGWNMLFAALALLVLAPVTEEILFRGFLHRRLKALSNVHISAVITSGLFGLAHWQWNVGLDTFVLSMVIIYVLEIKDNLLIAIAIHALKNSLAFLLLFVLN